MSLNLGNLVLNGKCHVMGILNVTPDSFYDGGLHFDLADTQKRVDAMVKEGVEIIDIGGESTRPGSKPVTIDEELDRVIPAANPLSLSLQDVRVAILRLSGKSVILFCIPENLSFQTAIEKNHESQEISELLILPPHRRLYPKLI